jgi:hypothetical protein
MTPYQADLLEVVRRLAERGLKHTQKGGCANDCVDVFQAQIDEIERIVKATL